MKKNDELRFLLEIRVFYYNLLKSIFLSEPNKDLLELISQENILDNLPFKEEKEIINEGANEIQIFFYEKNVLDEECFNNLHWDYTRMFIGPNKLPAPPWESAYLNEERLLFQQQTMEVRKAYIKYSFISQNYGCEPDDHIGLELDFMSKLSGNLIESFEKSNEEKFIELLKDQESFLNNHLLRWCDRFTEDIVNNSDTGFYKGFAKVLKGYLNLDYELMNECKKLI